MFAGIGWTVFAPMILARTDSNSLIFGSVQTAGAIGGVIMSAWGGFKRRVHGVLAGWIMSGLFFAMLGLGSGLPMWIPFIVLSAMVGPLVNTSNQAIWQSKVAPDVQGRVFSARRNAQTNSRNENNVQMSQPTTPKSRDVGVVGVRVFAVRASLANGLLLFSPLSDDERQIELRDFGVDLHHDAGARDGTEIGKRCGSIRCVYYGRE